MNAILPTPKPPRTWRDVPQAVPRRAMSRQGRRRAIFSSMKVAGLAVVAVVAAWSVYEVVGICRSDAKPLATAVKTVPLKRVLVTTDGVLGRNWVLAALALPANAGLMDLDLYALRTRLEAGGQVEAAVLTRNFPDALAVTLKERLPILRLHAQEGEAPARDLLVARDGVVYEGTGYDPAMIGRLPYLDGVKLAKNPTGGYTPVAGMDAVSDLLATAQLDAPHLYRQWKVISLERLAAYDQIIARAPDVPEAVFTRRDPYTPQLARLDTVIDYARSQGTALGRVDLTLGGSVPVQLQTDNTLFKPLSSNPPTRKKSEF